MILKLKLSIFFLVLLIPIGIVFAQENSHVVEVSETIKESDDEFIKNTEKINQFREYALENKEIPISEILDRVGDKWLAKYDNVEHFERTENAIKDHIIRNLEKSDWHKENAKNHLRIQNFETITEAIGHGHEITLLIAQQQKLQGSYNVTEPVGKFHTWLSTKYTIPATQEEISNKLVEILGDEKYLDLAYTYADSFNGLAEHGNVPNELVQSDIDFWLFIANVSSCEIEKNCDADKLRDSQTSDITLEELAQILELEKLENPTRKISTDALEHFIPESYAKWIQTYVNYKLNGSANTSRCAYIDCFENWFRFGLYFTVIDEMDFQSKQ